MECNVNDIDININSLRESKFLMTFITSCKNHTDSSKLLITFPIVSPPLTSGSFRERNNMQREVTAKNTRNTHPQMASCRGTKPNTTEKLHSQLMVVTIDTARALKTKTEHAQQPKTAGAKRNS